jgi:hypothetical protein
VLADNHFFVGRGHGLKHTRFSHFLGERAGFVPSQ